jgi:hypothetical protein
MTVPVRYILAALAFGVAALGFLLLPTDAAAQCTQCGPPPSCHNHCQPPPPPCCQPPTVVVPPPHVPPPNIVVVNAGARAQAQASAVAIAIANASGGDTIVRQNSFVQSGASAASNAATLAVIEASASTQTVARERDALVQAICLDARGNPHPASQTFAGRDVARDYRGEIYRCVAGTRMRYTVGDRSYDCAAGEALAYEAGVLACRPQIARRQCNERSLLRRFGPGDKMVHVRDSETRSVRNETTFSAAMTMDGGVGQGMW